MRTLEPDRLVLTEARPRARYLELEADYLNVEEASDEGDDRGVPLPGSQQGQGQARASPPSSWKERMAFSRRRNHDAGKEPAKSPKKDKNEPSRFMGEGVSFKAKLIGILEVAEARGDRMCQDALADLKMAIRAAGEHKQRITINIAIDGLRLRDEKTGDCLFHHPVHKISFIAQDMTDSRAFGYIFGSPDTGHRFFGIKTDKAASQVVVSMRDLFQVVFELKKKEIEMAKQHIEQHHLKLSNTSLSSTSGSAATVTYMESMAQHLKEAVRENGSSGATAAAPSSSAVKTEQPSEAIADLLDLEFELNSIQQGIHQMDRITPSDPCGPAPAAAGPANTTSKDDLFGTDPFGDSFTAGGGPTNRSNSTLSNKGAAAPVACLPPPPSVKDSVRADGTGTHRRERNTIRAPSSNVGMGVTSPAGTGSGSAPLAQEEKHWFDQETEALFDETELSQVLGGPQGSSSKTDQEAARLSPLDPLAPAGASDQFDVFTELDPLGTGRSKPYVDKKDFFQDLKNPPKKVLKDLVVEADPLSAPLFQASFETGSGSRDSGALGDVLSALENVPGSSSTGASSFPSFPDPFADDPFDKTDPFAEGSFSQTVSFSPNTVMQDPFETGFADFSAFPPGSRSSGASANSTSFPQASSSSAGGGGVAGSGGMHGPLRVTLPPEKSSSSINSHQQTSNCLSPSPPLISSKQRTPRFSRVQKQSSVSQLVKIPSPKSSQRSRSRLYKQVTLPSDGSQPMRFPPLGSSPTPSGPSDETLRRSPVGRGAVTPSPPFCTANLPFPSSDVDADGSSRLSGSSAELGEIAPEPPPRPAPNAFSIKPPPLPPKKHHTGAIFKPPPRPPQQDDHSHYDHIENYESSSSPTPLDGVDAKSPPIPVPARKPRHADEANAPLRPKKNTRVETEDGYLAPIPFLPPPVKRNQIGQSTASASKTSLDITLSQLTKTGFADLASTLGMSPSQLSRMTLQELTRCLTSLSADSTQVTEVPQGNRGSLGKAEYTALRESIDDDTNFSAEFEDNFDGSNLPANADNPPSNRESLYDKYAVFRELLEQTDLPVLSDDDSRPISLEGQRDDACETAEQNEHVMKVPIPHTSPITINILSQPESTATSCTVSSVSPSTSPATTAGLQQQQLAPSIDRYAALREISLCDEGGSTRDDDDDEREVIDIAGYAEVDNDVSDKDDSITEVVRNDEDQDLLTLSAQHSESTESPTLDTATVRDAPSIMETTILEEDLCSADGDATESPRHSVTTVAAPLNKSSALEPVPESVLEVVSNSTALSLTNGEARASGHNPASERAAVMKDDVVTSPGESWAKFDSSQFEKPISDEAVSPWSSDGKEFTKASVGWKDDSDHGSNAAKRETCRRMGRRSSNRGSGAWPEDEESEDVSEDQRSVSDRWENGWSDRESFDEAPPGGRPPRYQEPRKSRRRKVSPWRKGCSGNSKSSREASPWEGSDIPPCASDDRVWPQEESDFKRAWKLRPKNRGPSWEEERRMRGSWEGDVSEYEDIRSKRRQQSSPWASEEDWYPRRPPPDRCSRRREEEHRRRWDYERDWGRDRERDRERDRYGYGRPNEWPRAHPHYRERDRDRCSPEFAWDDELSEQGEDESPHGHPQGRKWRWSRPSSAASRSGHERVSPSSEYGKPRPDEEDSSYSHSRRRYREHGGSSVERRSRSRDDIFNSDQEHEYWAAPERSERTRSRTERDVRYEQRSQTLHSRRSNRSRFKTYDQSSSSVSFSQKSPFEDDFSAQRFDFSQESSLEMGETGRSPSVKVYAPRKKDSASESEDVGSTRMGDAVASSPLESGRGRGSSMGSSRRQSPFEDDFTPPETRNNSARHVSSASSDVSDQHRIGSEDVGSRSNSRPGSGRTCRRLGVEMELGNNGRSTDDVFLPPEANVPDSSPVSTLESICEPVISPNRPLSEHRRSLRSGEDKNLVGMKARLSNLRRTDSSSSLRKSESINIFARSCDPFDDDDFFNGEGSSPHGQPLRQEQASAARQGGDHFKWTEAFESFNFEEQH